MDVGVVQMQGWFKWGGPDLLEHVFDGALVQKTWSQSLDQRHAGPEHSKD